MDLRRVRKEYENRGLYEDDLVSNPIDQFKIWYSEIEEVGYLEPNAMVLSTVDKDCSPSGRNVLLKEIREDGFVFFTNYESKKAIDIENNEKVSLTFSWNELRRQVSVEGTAEKIPESESDEYWAMRPYETKIGSLVSNQSSRISSREELDTAFETQELKWRNTEVPRPHHWGGYKVLPNFIEFWQGRQNRLHDRIGYELTGQGWIFTRLSP
ncbi:MAG: pyridoxamine 5'-phosphate oxidase [Acidimicrobiales bacterium]|nr:pyridoxamine 5'-phosphate oxidase [Acidimicrobiales bacterium]|tara:strand:+ start:919 stop:1554 length:636 start_codon:yes stop_codon:yes gene_type:complete